MKLTADGRQLTAKSQHLEDMKEANPGGSPQKQKGPTKRLGRRRPTGLGPCSNKKSVLGRAGTRFSTSLTLPH